MSWLEYLCANLAENAISVALRMGQIEVYAFFYVIYKFLSTKVILLSCLLCY